MFNKANVGKHCYLVNKTKLQFSIGDLFLMLPPFKTIDLLDCYHSKLTEEQVHKSMESGCLAKLLNINPSPIAIREQKAPQLMNQKIDISKMSIPKSMMPNVKIEIKHFKELELDDINIDTFAEQNADQSELEHSAKINMRELSNNSESNIEEEK